MRSAEKARRLNVGMLVTINRDKHTRSSFFLFAGVIDFHQIWIDIRSQRFGNGLDLVHVNSISKRLLLLLLLL